jgi:hypothetical protein
MSFFLAEIKKVAPTFDIKQIEEKMVRRVSLSDRGSLYTFKKNKFLLTF